MRVSVVTPPVRDLYFTPGRNSALGMHTVSSILSRMGETVSVFNCPKEKPGGFPIPPLKETEHLKPFLIQGERGPVSFFTGYRQFGPSFEECAARIAAAEPDVILISCFAYAYAEDTVELVKSLRKTGCTAPIGAGGGGVSVFPQYFLASGIDFAVTGESERVIAPLLKELRKTDPDFPTVPNCYTSTHQGPHQGTVPPAVYFKADSSDLEFIWSMTGETKKTRYISTSLSRGCPRRCRFCSNFLTHGREFRKVSLDKISKGITQIPTDKHTVINFEDDNLSFDPEYLFEVLNIFTAHIPKLSFMAENGMDYSFLDSTMVKTLAKAGFRQLNLSLGTLSTAGAESENRHLSLSKYESVLEAAEKSEIAVITYFISGLEKDSPEASVAALRYLHNLPTLTGISPFYPVPGLPGFTDKKLFWAHSPSLCRGASFYPWNGTLSTAQLVTAFRLSRFSNLKKKGGRSDTECKLMEQSETEHRLYTIIKKNKGNRILPVPRMDTSMMEMFFK